MDIRSHCFGNCQLNVSAPREVNSNHLLNSAISFSYKSFLSLSLNILAESFLCLISLLIKVKIVSSLITLLPHDQIYRIGILNSTFVQSLIDKYAIEQSNDRLLKYSAHLLLGIILQHENKHEQANKNYLIAHNNHNKY